MIGDENEEDQIVLANDQQQRIQDVISTITDSLRSNEEDLRESLENWLENMPEPTVLESGVKEADLQRKLRWERMISSKDKIKKLQGIFQSLRNKKSKR